MLESGVKCISFVQKSQGGYDLVVASKNKGLLSDAVSNFITIAEVGIIKGTRLAGARRYSCRYRCQ
jgi:hypothetical protein